MRTILFAAVAASVGMAHAAPLSLAVDEASSSVEMEVSTNVAGFPLSGDDSAALGGTIDATLTLAGDVPMEVLLEDFSLILQSDIVIELNVPLAGTLVLTIPAGTTTAYADGPLTASPIDEFGTYEVQGVSASFVGIATATGTLGGQPINEAIDLSQLDPAAGSVLGTVSVDTMGEVTLTMSVSAGDTIDVEVVEGVTIPVSVFANGFALANATLADPCPGDINGDGFLNNTDINIFVTDFINLGPAGDFNGDGFWNNTDINQFVTAFTNGCG